MVIYSMESEETNGLNEDLLFSLQEFSKSGQNDIPPLLDTYITKISLTGETQASWQLVRPLLRAKLESVTTAFNQDTPVDNLYPKPNVESFKFTQMRSELLSMLDGFASAPFTIQRLCELLQSPRVNYKRVDKFMRGLHKVLSVTSCVDVHGVKIVSDRDRNLSETASMNGEYPTLASPRPRRDSRAQSPSFDAAEFRTPSEGSLSDGEASPQAHSPLHVTPGAFQAPNGNPPCRRPRHSGSPRSPVPLSDPDLPNHGLASPPLHVDSPKRMRLSEGALSPPVPLPLSPSTSEGPKVLSELPDPKDLEIVDSVDSPELPEAAQQQEVPFKEPEEAATAPDEASSSPGFEVHPDDVEMPSVEAPEEVTIEAPPATE